ncbi:hypothetical protein EAC14_11930 [Enterococcus faecium]|nr:hypothetical protein [Enterococcus faecium]
MADTIALMRKCVLDMAIRGELVEQRPKEGTAEELISSFSEFNKKEARIHEKPFQIPKNWRWYSLQEIAEIIMGQSPPGTSVSTEKKGIEFHQGKINFSNMYLNESDKKTDQPKKIVGKDTLLLSVRAPVGNLNITSREISIGRGLCGIKGKGEIDTKFLFYFLSTSKKEMEEKSTGTTFKAIAGNVIKAMLVPLPPLAEQKRIVSKIEEIFAIIDQIGTRKAEALTIINNMRQTALQDAIMGVLVEQDETDEPASELYEKIKNEKEKLVKEKKIKKEKPLPEIEENETPFEIPESWKFMRLKEAVYNHGQKKPDKTFSYIDIGSIDNKHTRLNAEEKIIEPEDAPSRARKIVKMGDILYSTVRPYLHNACIIDREFSMEPIASTGFAVMRTHSGILNRFLFHYLLSPTFDLFANDTANAKGTAYPAINDTKLYQAVIPLPPLNEQHRIVEKIDEIMAICDQMEAIFDGTSEANEALEIAE